MFILERVVYVSLLRIYSLPVVPSSTCTAIAGLLMAFGGVVPKWLPTSAPSDLQTTMEVHSEPLVPLRARVILLLRGRSHLQAVHRNVTELDHNPEEATAHVDSQFKCALCQYRSNVKETFQTHFQKNHPSQTVNFIDAYIEELRNPDEDEIIVIEDDIDVLRDSAKKVQKLKCGYCYAEGITENQILQHSKRAHPNMAFLIVTAPMPSVSTIKPIVHKRKYPKTISVFKCKYCKVYLHLLQLEYHHSIYHSHLGLNFPPSIDVPACSFPPLEYVSAEDFMCIYCNLNLENRLQLEDHHSTFHSHLDSNLSRSVVEMPASPSPLLEEKK